jgi:hypothetical protein
MRRRWRVRVLRRRFGVDGDGVSEGHAFGCIICVDITDIWVDGSMAPCVTISNGNYLLWEGLERTKPRLSLLASSFHSVLHFGFPC